MYKTIRISEASYKYLEAQKKKTRLTIVALIDLLIEKARREGK